MGIRFQCHHCGHSLHVKDFQAGKRGRCPQCQGQFRIPQSDAQFSLAADPNLSQPKELTGAVSASVATMIPSTTAKSVASSLETLATETPTPPIDNQLDANSDQRLMDRDEADFDHAKQLLPASEKSAVPFPQSLADLDQPRAIVEAPNANWYVRPATGGQYGPAPAAIFWQWLAEGRVGADSLIWRDDWPQWQSAQQVLGEFFGPQESAGLPKPSEDSSRSSSLMSATMEELPALEKPLVSAANDDIGSTPAPALPESKPTNQAMGSALLNEISGLPTLKSPIAKREVRRRSQRIKYSIAIGILVLLLVGLAVGLAVVLWRQAG